MVGYNWQEQYRKHKKRQEIMKKLLDEGVLQRPSPEMTNEERKKLFHENLLKIQEEEKRLEEKNKQWKLRYYGDHPWHMASIPTLAPISMMSSIRNPLMGGSDTQLRILRPEPTSNFPLFDLNEVSNAVESFKKIFPHSLNSETGDLYYGIGPNRWGRELGFRASEPFIPRKMPNGILPAAFDRAERERYRTWREKQIRINDEMQKDPDVFAFLDEYKKQKAKRLEQIRRKFEPSSHKEVPLPEIGDSLQFGRYVPLNTTPIWLPPKYKKD